MTKNTFSVFEYFQGRVGRNGHDIGELSGVQLPSLSCERDFGIGEGRGTQRIDGFIPRSTIKWTLPALRRVDKPRRRCRTDLHPLANAV